MSDSSDTATVGRLLLLALKADQTKELTAEILQAHRAILHRLECLQESKLHLLNEVQELREQVSRFVIKEQERNLKP